MTKNIFLILLSCLSFFFSCSSGTNESVAIANKIVSNGKDSTLKLSVLIRNVKCKIDSTISYALYLPNNYTLNKELPIIFFFDPHGNGSLPVDKYKICSEKYGYIFVGSNNSQNGISWEVNKPNIEVLMNDVNTRLRVNRGRIYTCGFSGGSRVASSVAIFNGGINAVIGMGAGFPSLSDPIRNHFDYIGFVGNQDFNLNEMSFLMSSMDSSPIRHHCEIFNGKHEWAPIENMDDAFVWLEFNAMKDGVLLKNDSLVKDFIAKNNSDCDNAYDNLLRYRKLVSFLDGLMDVSNYKQKADQISQSSQLKEILNRKAILAKKENEMQAVYRNNFLLKDFNWWKQEIKNLEKSSQSKLGKESVLMNKRLLSYLGLLSYMNCSHALRENQFEILEKYLKIYELVEPTNFEHQYIHAEVCAIKKENTQAFIFLRKAISLGFKDKARLNLDIAFSVLHTLPEFNSLLNELTTDR